MVLRGSPVEYLLVRANAYRGPIHVVETTDEAVNVLLSSSDESTLLTDAVTADYIANKVSVTPSRARGLSSSVLALYGSR